jgi:hypothetical protein
MARRSGLPMKIGEASIPCSRSRISTGSFGAQATVRAKISGVKGPQVKRQPVDREASLLETAAETGDQAGVVQLVAVVPGQPFDDPQQRRRTQIRIRPPRSRYRRSVPLGPLAPDTPLAGRRCRIDGC